MMITILTSTPLVPALLGLPKPSGQMLMIALGIIVMLFAVGAFVNSRPRVKARIAAGHDHAFGWIDRALTAWHTEGRLTDDEAERLRTELREPDFTAVLPHFGVHLAIGVVLRFPFGSMVRASYVLANMGLTHARFVTRRIGYRAFRRQMGIHSHLVLILTCVPGIGTFLSRFEAIPGPSPAGTRCARRGAAQAPAEAYERTGLRMALARTASGQHIDPGDGASEPGVRIRVIPARIMVVLALIAGGLFAVDIAMQVIDDTIAPSFLGWEPIYRILDLNSETSLGTWFAVTRLTLCTILLAVVAYASHRDGDRFARHWAFLAVIVLGFSIDEQAKFHDLGSGFGTRVREILGLGGLLYYGWVIVALISILTVVYAYRHFIFALPAGIRNAFIVAAGFYVGGEMGVEMIGGWVMDRQGSTLFYRILTSVEEFFGTIGVLVAFGPLLVCARTAIGPMTMQMAGPATQPIAITSVQNVIIQDAPPREASRQGAPVLRR